MRTCAPILCGVAVLCSTNSIRQSSAFLAPGLAIKQQNRRVASPSTSRRCAHVCAAQQRLSGATNIDMSSSGSTSGGIARGLKRALATTGIGLALLVPLVSLPGHSVAGDKRQIGDISASGLLFKDKLNVEAFPDPKVQGVTLYLSDFTRPVADKLMNGDMFSDPSSASMTCVRSGPVSVKDGIDTSKEGEELLKEDRSFFKSIVVRRLYDKEANNVVYVSFSSKLDTNSDGNKSRFKSSLCAIHVE